jgi:hypothetical protein
VFFFSIIFAFVCFWQSQGLTRAIVDVFSLRRYPHSQHYFKEIGKEQRDVCDSCKTLSDMQAEMLDALLAANRQGKHN